jgi:hypothetical protein
VVLRLRQGRALSRLPGERHDQFPPCDRSEAESATLARFAPQTRHRAEHQAELVADKLVATERGPGATSRTCRSSTGRPYSPAPAARMRPALPCCAPGYQARRRKEVTYAVVEFIHTRPDSRRHHRPRQPAPRQYHGQRGGATADASGTGSTPPPCAWPSTTTTPVIRRLCNATLRMTEGSSGLQRLGAVGVGREEYFDHRPQAPPVAAACAIPALIRPAQLTPAGDSRCTVASYLLPARRRPADFTARRASSANRCSDLKSKLIAADPGAPGSSRAPAISGCSTATSSASPGGDSTSCAPEDARGDLRLAGLRRASPRVASHPPGRAARDALELAPDLSSTGAPAASAPDQTPASGVGWASPLLASVWTCAPASRATDDRHVAEAPRHRVPSTRAPSPPPHRRPPAARLRRARAEPEEPDPRPTSRKRRFR